MIKNIGAIALGFLTLILVSCNEGLANEDMEYDVEIIDNAHILSPKICNYLRDLRVPNGLIPMIVTVDHIDSLKVAVYAEELMDSIADNYVDGYSFRKRGILLVVSKDPKLIQVRVGNMFSLYTRMRGITAGCNYLKMQRQISENNLDLMIISFLQNTISGIEAFSSLPWIARRLYFVSQMWDWFEWLEDLSTPSESFFSKFYFQPFLFFVSFLYTLIKNWAITLIIILLLYYPLKYFIKRITSTYFQNLNKKFCSYWDDESLVEKIKGRGAVETVLRFSYNNISFIIVFPSLTAIFFLSSLRMEDIITLESVHIPFVSFSEIIDYNENLQPPIWMLLLMGVFFYLKSILKDSELLSLACSKEELELSKYDDNRKADLYYKISKFNSILAVVPFIYLTAKSDAFKKRPYYAIFINTSRRAIVFSIIFVYFSSFFLPRIIVLNFIILWFLNSLFHYKALTKFYNYIRFRNDNIALTIFYSEWKRYFIPIILCLVLICRNNLYNVPVAFTNYNINYIPFESINIKGSYYLVEKDGEKVKGWTADIKEVDSTHYYLYIYSDYPIQRYELEYCPSEYIINSEFLGTGIIEYKKEISKTIIKFSNKWVLEK